MSENLPRFVIRYIAVVVSITALVSAYVAYNSSANLKTSLIEACEQNRVPLAEYFANEIKRTKATDPSLFPDIPEQTFRELIRESVQNLREVTGVYDPAACETEYE